MTDDRAELNNSTVRNKESKVLPRFRWSCVRVRRGGMKYGEDLLTAINDDDILYIYSYSQVMNGSILDLCLSTGSIINGKL